MAKFCTNCGNKLEDNAAMCLNCGKILDEATTNNNLNTGVKNKKKGLPTWAIILIIVGCVVLIPIIIIFILGIVGYNAINDVIDDVVENNEESQTLVGTINDTLKNDDLKITLNDALMYSSIGDGYYVDTPADGKEYLVFFLEIENLDDENVYISSYDFDGYVDGYSVSSESFFDDIDGVEQLSSDLAPGMKVNGYVAFEIDATWQNFEIHFEEFDLDFEEADDKFVFKVKNNEEERGGV